MEKKSLIQYFNAYVLFPYLEKKAQRQISPKLAELREFDSLSLESQDLIRRNELYKILQFSRERVPYYRDLFSRIGFDESKILKDIKFIEDLPILTKEIIRESSDRIRLPAAHHIRKTGGSTGQSVFFYYDNNGLDWTSAINMMAYEMAGNFPHMKDCHISSELELAEPPWRARFLDWLKLFSQNRARLMIRSFSDSDMKESFSQLRNIKPYLLQGHPSSAYAIANYIKTHQLKKKKYCSVFEPSGEMLTPKIVETIEEYLGCRVVNRYGNAEFGVMAHTRPQDPYNKLQIFNRAFYFEEVEAGDLIVTNFTNYSFPLFRYMTGDIGTVRNETEGSFLYDIQGRIHDLVQINGESYATHYIMDYLDHKIRNIREFQVVVKDVGNPVLNVVLEDEKDRERVLAELKKRWPTGLDFNFIQYEELLKVGWQQKFRHLIDLRGKA